MRHVCTHCKQTSVDGNLWCQDIECPAGTLPSLMNYGDYLGNIQIVKMLRVLRSGVVYEALRDGTHYLLKVANLGDEKYLENEAAVLQNHGLAWLPTLAPHGAENPEAYGKVVFRGKLREYLLFNHVSGEFLTDYLLKNPEPYHKHIGWFMLGLTQAVMAIHAQNKLHLNINPEHILVWMNGANVPQPLLLDLGLLETSGTRIIRSQMDKYDKFMMSSYMPPEMIRGGEVTTASDVYELGLILFEMLGGSPAHPYKLRRKKDIRESVTAPGRLLQLKRGDLPGLASIAESAVQKEPSQRPANAAQLYQTLAKVYRDIPQRNSIFRLGGWQTAALVMALIIVVMFVFMMLLLAAVEVPTLAMMGLGE